MDYDNNDLSRAFSTHHEEYFNFKSGEYFDSRRMNFY